MKTIRNLAERKNIISGMTMSTNRIGSRQQRLAEKEKQKDDTKEKTEFGM